MTGNTIHLRAPEFGDIPEMYSWENDPEVWQVSHSIVPLSQFAVEQYILNYSEEIFVTRQMRLMIVLKEKREQLLGAIDLFDYNPVNRRVGIGLLITSEHRNKGYASEAISLMLNYCFETLNLHQVYCNISADNALSIKLFENNGFEHTGTKKQWIYREKHWIDELFFQHIRK